MLCTALSGSSPAFRPANASRWHVTSSSPSCLDVRTHPSGIMVVVFVSGGFELTSSVGGMKRICSAVLIPNHRLDFFKYFLDIFWLRCYLDSCQLNMAPVRRASFQHSEE